MAAHAPARSGFRISAAEDIPTTYAHPPLVESWLSVDFATGNDFLVKNAESARIRLGPEWTGSWSSCSSGIAPHGMQLTNFMGDRALRLTDSGFAYGWLGHSGERYPRYESIRDGFVATFDAVRSLTNDNNSPKPVPNKWSVCYANRVPQGTVWSTPAEWTFFALWQPLPIKGLGLDPAGIRTQWDLPLEAERGILTIEFRHEQGDSQDIGEFVWINMRAAGDVEDGDAGLFDCFDYGREVIVRSFNELVSPSAKSYWGVSVRPR